MLHDVVHNTLDDIAHAHGILLMAYKCHASYQHFCGRLRTKSAVNHGSESKLDLTRAPSCWQLDQVILSFVFCSHLTMAQEKLVQILYQRLEFSNHKRATSISIWSLMLKLCLFVNKIGNEQTVHLACDTLPGAIRTKAKFLISLLLQKMCYLVEFARTVV